MSARRYRHSSALNPTLSATAHPLAPSHKYGSSLFDVGRSANSSSPARGDQAYLALEVGRRNGGPLWDYGKDLSLTTPLDAVGALGPEAIGSLFGTGMAASTVSATTDALRTTLGGVPALARDAAGDGDSGEVADGVILRRERWRDRLLRIDGLCFLRAWGSGRARGCRRRFFLERWGRRRRLGGACGRGRVRGRIRRGCRRRRRSRRRVFRRR